jgi:hypothetical protein
MLETTAWSMLTNIQIQHRQTRPLPLHLIMVPIPMSTPQNVAPSQVQELVLINLTITTMNHAADTVIAPDLARVGFSLE